jgi:hypothetical protein
MRQASDEHDKEREPGIEQVRRNPVARHTEQREQQLGEFNYGDRGLVRVGADQIA